MPDDPVLGVIFSLAPTVIVGLIFWYVIRSIVRADRTERRVYAQIEAEERAKLGLPERSVPDRPAADS